MWKMEQVCVCPAVSIYVHSCNIIPFDIDIENYLVR